MVQLWILYVGKDLSDIIKVRFYIVEYCVVNILYGTKDFWNR